ILSAFASVIFLGGYAFPFGLEAGWWWQLVLMVIKTTVFILVFMWIGATFARMRIDQLMAYAWKVLIPLTFVQIFVTGLVKVYSWPDAIMGVASAAALVLAAMVVRRSVMTSTR